MGAGIIDKYAFPKNIPKNDYREMLGDRLHQITLNISKSPKIYLAVYDPPCPPKLTIIYSHANAETLYFINYYIQYIASTFKSQVIAFDWEGYGLSDGTSGEKQLLRGSDAVYDYVIANFQPDPSKILFWGRSIGTVSSTYLAQMHPSSFGVILQSPLASAFHTVFKKVICSSCDGLDSNQRIKKVNIPVFIIHGIKDQIVDYNNAQILFQSYIDVHDQQEGDIQKQDDWFTGVNFLKFGDCELYSIKNAGHNDIDSIFRRQMCFIVKRIISQSQEWE
ncbi:Alpha/beta hydrolase family protein [Spironucleus salmonicida]|uniref:Alpha/beta hydrolase family protein n=1 Tax=Spironucleus salmonicida TaxID=348837 RepID=V6LDV8_9EUKA|nr:Alpha/beta hydrolase family protein [Spironucleus salmonicida]|eukprot:EST41876.1 Alpha/beta hydrolase family protein [Spironucleus salmonicida]